MKVFKGTINETQNKRADINFDFNKVKLVYL